MANDRDEEIEDADSDTEINSDEEDTDEEDDESADGDEDAEDDDDDTSDSDDEAPLPKSRKEFDKAVGDAVKAALKSSKNRSGAAERTSKKPLSERKRPVSDSRVDEHEKAIADMRASEAKRQFGYDNDLAPDEVDVVFRFSKTPTKKTLRDPIVKGALDGFRQAKSLRKNTPSGSSRSVRVGGKDTKDMSQSERRSNLTSRRQEILDRKRGR